MIEIRTELAEIIRFEQPLARRRLPAVHSGQVHRFLFCSRSSKISDSETTFKSDDQEASISSCKLW